MVCVRDLNNKESLESEFKSIRKSFETFTEEEKPLRIMWGTVKAFDEMEKTILWKEEQEVPPKKLHILDHLLETKGEVCLKLCEGETHSSICQELTILYREILENKEEETP